MKDKSGWDGKMRVDRTAVITNPEALEDTEYSDPDAPPVEQIEADEGELLPFCFIFPHYQAFAQMLL